MVLLLINQQKVPPEYEPRANMPEALEDQKMLVCPSPEQLKHVADA
jgi:hypothetical protein